MKLISKENIIPAAILTGSANFLP